MRAKNTGYLTPARTTLFTLALFCSSLINAQSIDIQNSIDSTAEALILLDVKASDCLQALDAGTESRQLCDDFMAAIDGELMADYLEMCRELKAWRDGYVDEAVALDLDAGSANNEEMLRRLIAIEYSCGENTVLNRTEFVATAFERLHSDGSSAVSTNQANSISRQLSERRFTAVEERERQNLQESLRNQQLRSQRESERQFNDLENELLRQQIQNANRPN